MTCLLSLTTYIILSLKIPRHFLLEQNLRLESRLAPKFRTYNTLSRSKDLLVTFILTVPIESVYNLLPSTLIVRLLILTIRPLNKVGLSVICDVQLVSVH